MRTERRPSKGGLSPLERKAIYDSLDDEQRRLVDWLIRKWADSNAAIKRLIDGIEALAND